MLPLRTFFYSVIYCFDYSCTFNLVLYSSFSKRIFKYMNELETTSPSFKYFFPWGKVSCSLGWPEICYVVEDDLEPLLSLPTPENLKLEVCTTLSISGAEEQTQGFLHARQVLYQISHIPSLILYLWNQRWMNKRHLENCEMLSSAATSFNAVNSD